MFLLCLEGEPGRPLAVEAAGGEPGRCSLRSCGCVCAGKLVVADPQVWAGAERVRRWRASRRAPEISGSASASGLVPGRADQVAAQPGGSHQGRGWPKGDRMLLEQLPRRESADLVPQGNSLGAYFVTAA
jgi:hypothetical protein